MSEKKLTGGKLFFWFVTGIFVMIASIILGIVPGLGVRLLISGGNFGATILFIIGGLLLVVYLIILGVSAIWGTKQTQRWKRGG